MTCQVNYTANGSTVVFPYPFAIPAKTALEVHINGVVQDVGFHITSAGSQDGGTVVFGSAPADGHLVSLLYLGAVTISAQDATAGHLSDKLVAGSGITLETVTEPGGVQCLKLHADASADVLEKDQNLADLPDSALARTNLGVYSKAETEARDQAVKDAALLKTDGLNGLTNPALARSNLDVYSKAEVDTRDQSVTAALEGKLAGLSGVTNVAAAQIKLDVYSKGEVDGRDQAVTSALEGKLANLSGVTDVEAAQAKLDVYPKGEVDGRNQAVTSALEGKLANLSGVTDVEAARTKLDVYSKGEATLALTSKLSGLSGVTDAVAARSVLGLDQVAYLNVAQDWVKPQRSQAVLIASVGGSAMLDFAQYQNFDLTLNADITFANPTVTAAMVGQKGTIGITPAGFAIAGMDSQWKRVGTTGSPDVITGIGRIDYHIRALDRVEYAYNDVEA